MFNLQARSEENTNTAQAQIVRETKDYNQFRLIVGNRELKEQNIKSVTNQIAHRGQTTPIIVNERYQVIDGQHRLEACRRLNIPVKFIIDKKANLDDVVSTNIVGQKWTLADFVNRYAVQGNEDYVKLQKLINECKKWKISATAALNIANGGHSDDTFYMCDDGKLHKHGSRMKVKKLYCVGSAVKIGLFKMKDEKKAYDSLQAITLFQDYAFFTKSSFIQALLQVLRIKDFDVERLLKNAKKYPRQFSNEATVNNFIEMFEKVYNYRMTQKMPLVYNPERKK